jgi:hypothetical protein
MLGTNWEFTEKYCMDVCSFAGSEGLSNGFSSAVNEVNQTSRFYRRVVPVLSEIG